MMTTEQAIRKILDVENVDDSTKLSAIRLIMNGHETDYTISVIEGISRVFEPPESEEKAEGTE